MATKTEKAAPKAAKSTKAASESAPAKAAPKAAAAKTAKPAAKAAGAKPNALQQPLKPSAELGAIVGTSPLPRGEVVSKVWEYIKKHNLQNPTNKREIVADDKLKKVFGKDKCSMFEMNKHLAAHLKA
jgi:chromatin remodeling complex protein RSC6